MKKIRPSAFGCAVLAGAGLLVFQATINSASEPNAKDPGVRSGIDAGFALPGLSAGEFNLFTLGKEEFEEAEEIDEGLGPRLNLGTCVGCHSQPATGGSSPAVNPQVAFARAGADFVPSFIKANGPVREARFVRNADGTPDGGVHALFTITGRDGADGCTLRQPDFETQVANKNVVFRIPTPVFGEGLIEQIPDAAILSGHASSASARSALGVRGRANFAVAGRTVSGQSNHNGNDGTIARFGWKAQNKSLLIFSGEAYNVEMGITNEMFQTERDETRSCQFGTNPNSVTNTEAETLLEGASAVEKFAFFMRLAAPPTPSVDTPGGSRSIGRGRTAFTNVGCALCHRPSFMTGNSAIAALRNKPVNLFSDLLTHDMGTGLSDGITQGEAGPREFRTAPLWGLGQRVFFLHDGRASDLVTTIRAHQSQGSEANGVVSNFLSMSEGQKQDLLNFLRSL